METARILIVDDDESTCYALALLLRGERFVVETACDGEQGLAAALRLCPDLVLTDIVMPGIDGMDLCARLHASDPDLPVIVMTASADMQSAVTGMRAGAVDYLTKPVDIDAVLIAVRRALDSRAARVEREELRLRTARLYEEALAAIQWREEVLSIVSHDLRNPLNVIHGHAQRLSKSPPDAERADEVRSTAAAILRSTGRMRRLIDDLLDGTQIRGGRLHLEPARHRVADILADVSDLRPLALQKRIRLMVVPLDQDVFLFCDRARIGQVLSNLVANAIKFSLEEGTVIITMECMHGGVRFVVRDEGLGIPAEKVSLVFDRFWQSKSDGHGLGLGLFIAKGIVDAHGGRLWVESAEREGTTFFCFVPCEAVVRDACEAKSRSAAEPASTPPSSGTLGDRESGVQLRASSALSGELAERGEDEQRAHGE